MSEGRSHWIQHQDINTADRSLSEWFNKNNSRASTPLSDFSAIIRKKSLWISVEYSSHSLFLLITDNLFMLWSLMAHVYCVEWKTKKFQEFIVGQFRAKFGHVIQAPVMLIITVQCTLYCSVFKNYFLFPPLLCYIGSQIILRIIYQILILNLKIIFLSNFSPDLCKVLLFRVCRYRILLLKIAFTYCYHYHYLCYLRITGTVDIIS